MKKWKRILAAIAVLLCLQGCSSVTVSFGKKSISLPNAPRIEARKNATPATQAPTLPETTAPEESTEPETTEPETTVPATETPTQPEPTKPAGIRPDFKAAMDSYEAFYNDYCDFMEKYTKNPADLSLLSKYADMLSKAADMDRKFAAWKDGDLSPEEFKYYLDVQNRIQKRLVELM